MKYLITIVCAAFGFIIINPVLANSCSSSSAYCVYFVGLQTGEKRLLKVSGSKNGTASGSKLLCVSNDDTLELTQQDAVGIKN